MESIPSPSTPSPLSSYSAARTELPAWPELCRAEISDAAPSLKSEASPLFRSSHRAVAAAAPPRLFHTELTPTDRRSYCRCISEESVRWYFTTGPSDRCSSESSGTDSPVERPLSQPHISTGVSSVTTRSVERRVWMMHKHGELDWAARRKARVAPAGSWRCGGRAGRPLAHAKRSPAPAAAVRKQQIVEVRSASDDASQMQMRKVGRPSAPPI